MKSKLLYGLTFLTLLQACQQQKSEIVHRKKTNYIDSLQTERQIEAILAKNSGQNNDKIFQVNSVLTFSDPKCQKIADSLHLKSWQKADWDQNGLTDLLVLGHKNNDWSAWCILDTGKNQYEIKRLSLKSDACTFPVVRAENGFNLMDYYFYNAPERGDWKQPKILTKVSLIYKYGDFIEYNSKPVLHHIEKIEYSTGPCFGTCPIFKLTLNADHSAIWYAEHYNKINNKEVSGDFKTVLKPDSYQEMVDLLNYMDFEKLKENYAVAWTDDQSSTLKITYDNGKIKQINDYGLQGTFGLEAVYRQLFEWRHSQAWTKIK